jgi:hypothetical protein
MFKVGDKVVYQWDPTKYYGVVDSHLYGVGYGNLENGDILTVDCSYIGFVNGTTDYLFDSVEFGDYDSFNEKYFIPLFIYERKNKINKLKECLK